MDKSMVSKKKSGAGAGAWMVYVATRAAAMEGLPAESSYRLQKVGGDILAMLK